MFSLYEDDGESSAPAPSLTVRFTWHDAAAVLEIGSQSGGFEGALTSRTVNAVVVRPGHGTGFNETQAFDAVVTYTGAAQNVSLGAARI